MNFIHSLLSYSVDPIVNWCMGIYRLIGLYPWLGYVSLVVLCGLLLREFSEGRS